MLAAALAVAAPAYAQNAQFNVGPGGFQMKFEAPDGHHDDQEPFRVSYEPTRARSTVFKILAPEGLRAEVFDGKKRVASDTIPLSFEAKGDRFYRVVIDLPHGERFEKKIATKRKQHTNLWVHVPERRHRDHDRDHDRREEREEVSVVESSAEGYRLEFRSHPERRTLFKLVAPEGLHAQIFDGDRLIADEDIPLSFDAKPDDYYRFVIFAPDGSHWEKKFAARRGQEGVLSVRPPSAPVVIHHPPPQPTHPSRPIPPPHPAGPVAMASRDFRALLDAIAHESFPADKMNVLTTATPSAFFTIDQVGELVDAFTFPNDKVDVVRVTRDRILDRQNAFKLYSHFTFPNDKETVKKLLAQ